jgi:hypothetical protein
LIRGKGSTLKVLVYFDWAGSRKELKEWLECIVKACDETEVEYEGLYGPLNEKWNYVGMFETESYDEFRRMTRKVSRRSHMTHTVSNILVKINL